MLLRQFRNVVPCALLGVEFTVLFLPAGLAIEIKHRDPEFQVILWNNAKVFDDSIRLLLGRSHRFRDGRRFRRRILVTDRSQGE